MVALPQPHAEPEMRVESEEYAEDGRVIVGVETLEGVQSEVEEASHLANFLHSFDSITSF